MLVFEDVTEDFSDLSIILQHFEDWRKRDIDSYKDTFFNICLPKVCHFFFVISLNQIFIIISIFDFRLLDQYFELTY